MALFFYWFLTHYYKLHFSHCYTMVLKPSSLLFYTWNTLWPKISTPWKKWRIYSLFIHKESWVIVLIKSGIFKKKWQFKMSGNGALPNLYSPILICLRHFTPFPHASLTCGSEHSIFITVFLRKKTQTALKVISMCQWWIASYQLLTPLCWTYYRSSIYDIEHHLDIDILITKNQRIKK